MPITYIGSYSIDDVSWLSDEIRAKNSWLSFQQPEKISDALKNISDSPIWERMSINNLNARDIKTYLKLFVDWRNKIAHEADINHTSIDNQKWPIDSETIDYAIEFIEKFGDQLFQILETEKIQ